VAATRHQAEQHQPATAAAGFQMRGAQHEGGVREARSGRA
jgi:hypothetical protein